MTKLSGLQCRVPQRLRAVNFKSTSEDYRVPLPYVVSRIASPLAVDQERHHGGSPRIDGKKAGVLLCHKRPLLHRNFGRRTLVGSELNSQELSTTALLLAGNSKTIRGCTLLRRPRNGPVRRLPITHPAPRLGRLALEGFRPGVRDTQHRGHHERRAARTLAWPYCWQTRVHPASVEDRRMPGGA